MQVMLSYAKMKDVCYPEMERKVLGCTFSGFHFFQKSLFSLSFSILSSYFQYEWRCSISMFFLYYGKRNPNFVA